MEKLSYEEKELIIDLINSRIRKYKESFTQASLFTDEIKELEDLREKLQTEYGF